MQRIYLTIVLAPLLASVIAGLFGRAIGRPGAHSVTILGVAISCALSLYVLYQFTAGGMQPFNATVYTWMVSDGVHMQVGFLVDRLTAMMMAVVTFVSLMVHVYTIGYMHDDDGYQRFFSYISLFTFAMLMLVMSNNFMQLFFGWEAVGTVSYLLIGFWYTRPTAIFANLKAFLVNRVGDFGFVLGIAAVLRYTGSLDYATVFAHADNIAAAQIPITGTVAWPAITFACICLFIGAMGKSAQVPLHIWLPDSMEGPTPISALIHAATMVTAGIFMVARMSPLFELSETALSFVLLIGATTAFFMGLLGVVANDIKRVIAYSTLSQLGYMTVALGGLGHHGHASRAGHAQDGRTAQVPAGDLLDLPGGLPGVDRFSRHVRILLQGSVDRRGGRRPCRRSSRLLGLRVFLRAERRLHHRAVYLPHVLHDVSRQGAHGSSHAGAFAREPLGGDRATRAAGNPVGGDRLADCEADAVRRFLRGQHSCQRGKQRARTCRRGIPRVGGLRPDRAYFVAACPGGPRRADRVAVFSQIPRMGRQGREFLQVAVHHPRG
jgi:NADH-quinone oxidoreductase subunit L